MADQIPLPPDITVETRLRVMVRREQAGMLVPVDEWDTLVDRVDHCKAVGHPLAVAYSVLFGIGATAALSIAPIVVSELSWWVITTYAVIATLGLSAGVVVAITDRILAKNQSDQIDHVNLDMRRTRESFVHSGDDV